MEVATDVRVVLFDAAGTLIELREGVGETYARMAREYGVEIPAWRIEDAFSRILSRAPARVVSGANRAQIEREERDWWRKVVRSTFLAADSTARFSDFDAYFDALYARYSAASSWQRRPGCRSALGALRARGLTLGIVSNFDQRLPRLLRELELAPFFAAVVLPPDAGAEKPDRRIFEFALARLATAARNAVFVGDSQQRDLDGARAVGMRAIDVRSLATLAELPETLTTETRSPEPP
jgi:putative hydrolase of the HAD superfamily